MPTGRVPHDHPAFRTAFGVVVGYGVLLVLLVLGVYAVPYVLFRVF